MTSTLSFLITKSGLSKLRVLMCLLVWLGALTHGMRAQSPVPDSLNPGPDNLVGALAVQADGKILLGGNFDKLGGQRHQGFGRLNTDGSLDLGFKSWADGGVGAIALQPDGRIVLGGAFAGLGGQTRERIGRVGADGALDKGFNPTANKEISSLVVQADGKILVGGLFSWLGGQPRSCVGRLNTDGTLDGGFNPTWNSWVSCISVQADGKILVGKSLSSPGGIARFNADGTLDNVVFMGTDDPVYCLAVQADGKILLGGGFTKLGVQKRNRIARLNPDGTLDSDFNPDANDGVYALAVQADGHILVGGAFTRMGGQARYCIARLKTDGALDDSFNPGILLNDSEHIPALYSLALQEDGRILVGGEFISIGGLPRTNFARLNNTEPATQKLAYDSSTVTWLRGGTSPEVWRTTFEHSVDDGATWIHLGSGKRIPSGWQLNGISLAPRGLVRARGYVTGSSSGSGWYVETIFGAPVISIQPQAKTNNAGTTTTITVEATGSAPLSYRWFKDETPLLNGDNVIGALTAGLTLSNLFGKDAGNYQVVVNNSEGSVTSAVASLTVIDPLILVQPRSFKMNQGESLTLSVTAIGADLKYEWRKDGVALAQQNQSTLTLVNLQRADAGNYVVVVSNLYGTATSEAAVLTVNLAAVDSGFNAQVVNSVFTLAAQADRKLLVGGLFTNVWGEPRHGIGRLNADGTLDADFNPGDTGTNISAVFTLAIQGSGHILVGGIISTPDGQPRYCIARLKADGVRDNGFYLGADNNVVSLVVQADEKILVGGWFTVLGGKQRSYIARLNIDQTIDDGFNPGANGNINSLAVQADGKIVVGGLFTTLAGQPRNRIGRLNADGTLDVSFNPGAEASRNPGVYALAVQANGKILAGGYFTSLSGKPCNCIGRLNADGSLDSEFTSQANSTVVSIVPQVDGKVLVGGAFTTVSGQPRKFIGRLNADGTLDIGFIPDITYGIIANASVYALAEQADGKILVGGEFESVCGQAHTNIARLNNTAPATQKLSFEGTNITWLRGGTSPEAWQATFEHSPDGSTWTQLGAGTRIAGGWQLGGLPALTYGMIRVRGHLNAGLYNGSSWFVENVLDLNAALTKPELRIVLSDGWPALWATGELAKAYILEYLPALSPGQPWRTITSIILTNSPQMIPAPTLMNATEGYYRLRRGP